MRSLFDCRTGFTHENPNGGPDEWYTPREIFDALGIDFDIDVCSPGANVVPWIPAQRHLTRSDDGIVTSWYGRVWCNPPYGRSTAIWLDKMNSHRNGIALVMSRTDTDWFHRYVTTADVVCFIKGRISFISPDIAKDYAIGRTSPKGNCGAGSILLGFGGDCIKPIENCGLGWVIKNA